MLKKSKEHHKAAGNYRADRHNKTTPGANLVTTLPPPPLNLDATGKAIYKRAGAALIEAGFLNESDTYTLACYAREAAIYEQQSAAAEGQIVVVLSNKVTAVSHARRAAETALKNMLAIGDRLGLNPKARFSMAAHVEPPDDDDDPFAFLLEN